MKMDNAQRFNLNFITSQSNGRVTELFGKDLMLLVKSVVKRSKIRKKPKETLDIVCSDLTLESIDTFHKICSCNKSINNPYGYFRNSIGNMLSTMLRYRFSSVATKDIFGQSIITRGARNRVIRSTFESIENYEKLENQNGSNGYY